MKLYHFIALAAILMIAIPRVLSQSNDFHVCHTSDPLKANSKYFLRIENKEKHSIFVQIHTKDEGEVIYRLHPTAVLEQWMVTPNQVTKISIAARKGEECGMVRLVLWDYYRYVTTLIWIFAVAVFWICAVVGLGCACCMCVLKARNKAIRDQSEPTRYQMMKDDDITSVVISHQNDDDLVPFSTLNEDHNDEIKPRTDTRKIY